MTNKEAAHLLAKAKAKADKFGAPVVLDVFHQGVHLLRAYSPTRQAAILVGQ